MIKIEKRTKLQRAIESPTNQGERSINSAAKRKGFPSTAKISSPVTTKKEKNNPTFCAKQPFPKRTRLGDSRIAQTAPHPNHPPHLSS